MKKVCLTVGLLVTAISFAQTLDAERNELNFLDDSTPAGFMVYNGKLVFNAMDRRGREPWTYDPQTGKATIIKDLLPGEYSSIPEQNKQIRFKNKIFFIGADETKALKLWSTDGTAAGTQAIKTIRSSSYQPKLEFAVTDNLLFFVFDNQLWASDGTTDGTRKINQFDYLPTQIYGSGTHVYFSASDGVDGIQLWKSDGTFNGTIPLGDLIPGGSRLNKWFHAVNNRVVFIAINNGKSILLSSDGTPQGTVTLKSDLPQDIVYAKAVMHGNLFFGLAKGLWITDGTVAGTKFLKTLQNVPRFSPAKTKMYITTNTETYTSDGTPAGTVLHPLIADSRSYNITWSSPVSDNILFSPTDNGKAVYFNNGVPLQSIDTGLSSYYTVPEATEIGDNIYISAYTDQLNTELFAFNTKSNTSSLVADINRRRSASPASFAILGGDLIFRASDGKSRGFFKRSRATGKFERLSTAPEPPTYGSLNDQSLVAAGNYLYLSEIIGGRILRTAGTSGTTEVIPNPELANGYGNVLRLSDNKVAIINSDYNSSALYTLTNDRTTVEKLKTFKSLLNPKISIADHVYFLERDTTVKLWRSDGTVENTEAILDFPLSYQNAFSFVGRYNNEILFAKPSEDGDKKNQLWKAGVTDAAVLLREFPPTASVLPVGGQIGDRFLYIVKNDAEARLYSTKGTAESNADLTVLEGFNNYEFTGHKNMLCGDSFYFTSLDQLWKVHEPSNKATLLLSGAGNEVDDFTCINKTLFAQFKTPNKFFKTDDTDKSGFFTVNVTNGDQVQYASGNEFTRRLVTDGEKLFFTAYSPDSGSELHTITSPLPIALAVNEPKNGAAQLQVKIYPNPVTDVVNLQLPAGHRMERAEILDISGKTVKSLQLSGNLGINIGSLNSGMYIIKIITDKDMFTGKFIKK